MQVEFSDAASSYQVQNFMPITPITISPMLAIRAGVTGS